MAAPSSASALVCISRLCSVCFVPIGVQRVNPAAEPYAGIPSICSQLIEAKARKGTSSSRCVACSAYHLAQDCHSKTLAKPSDATKSGSPPPSTRRCAPARCTARVHRLTVLQAKMTPDDITKLSQLLEIQQDLLEAELGAHWWPRRGLGPMPPNDPVLYRLYEVSARAFPLRPSDDLSWASMPGCARIRPCH